MKLELHGGFVRARYWVLLLIHLGLEIVDVRKEKREEKLVEHDE